MVDAGTEGGDVHVPVDDRILEVVHRVADVVGEVHDLCLDAPTAIRCPGTQPLEDLGVVVVEAVLAAPTRVGHALGRGPRILATGVEAGPGEVEPVAAVVVAEDLRLDAGEHAQGLRISLETADVGGPVVERALAIVAERRVAEVMGEARGVDDIGVEPETVGELAADLRDLQRVGEAVAREVEAGRRAQHLRFGRQPAKRARVQHSAAIAGEVAAATRVLLRQPALPVRCRVFRAIRHWCSTRLR